MTLATELLTLQEFIHLPNIEESPAWELLDGVPCQKPMPTLHHSRLQKWLVATIDGLGSPYEAFPELRCTLSHNSVVPDVTVIHQARVPQDNEPINGAPDWAIEILSPDQSTTKVIAKIQSCLQEGTKLGWLIDPKEKVVMIFWPDRPLALLKGQAVLPVISDLELVLTVEELFDCLQPNKR
ncbi:MAG: Uma2 family endonuclease [Symploca sp. SIO2C1]|nr:Uma2 family endonuclease [Symploca sp. SIO2C1]